MGLRLAFPPFTFDRDERVLRRDGATVPLAPKVADALGLLLAEPGALVEKNALRDALWPEGFVEDGNLTQTIYLIRRALDPDGDGRGFVETIPRRGYRFVRPVEVASDIHAALQPLQPLRPRAARIAFALRSLAGAAAIAIAFGGVSLGDVSSRAAAKLDGEAGRAYTLGWYTWNRRTAAGAKASIAHFQRVVTLLPNDPRGYAGLAATYAEAGDWEFTAIAPRAAAYRRAEEYAHEALRRDAHSGEALGTLGFVAFQRDNDLERAEAELRNAIAFSPEYAPAYQSLGIVRLYRGDADGARAFLARATELDPLSMMDVVWYGKSLYYGKRFAEARTAIRQLAELDVNNHGASEVLILADIELGLRDEARAAVAKMRAAAPHKRDYTAMLAALIDARNGRAPENTPDLRPRRAAHIDATTASALCLALGRREDALAWLEIGLKEPSARKELGMIRIDPRLAGLRADQRFEAIVARAG
jgi:DNA-binding winged helix-turn-helix (wHTH) protein/Tfp pilus assembly protein PilF